MITKKLKAAEPTIVYGPMSPAWKPFLKFSISARNISGAEDPKARSVNVATVSFHTGTVIGLRVSGSVIFFFLLVILSIAFTKMSEMMAIPKKQ